MCKWNSSENACYCSKHWLVSWTYFCSCCIYLFFVELVVGTGPEAVRAAPRVEQDAAGRWDRDSRVWRRQVGDQEPRRHASPLWLPGPVASDHHLRVPDRLARRLHRLWALRGVEGTCFYRVIRRHFHSHPLRRLKMRRWSFTGVRKLRVNSKPRFAFQQWNRGWYCDKKLKKAPIGMSSMSENHWWYLFHKEVKSWDFTTWFRIWQFQTRA